MQGDIAFLPSFGPPRRQGSGTLNPRFVAWPLELGLGTRNPRFVACPRFPFFMTPFRDSMHISSIGGIWSANLWNPKYASHVYKVIVAVDMLGNIVGQHYMDLPLGPQDIR